MTVSVRELLETIRGGRLRLPAFQRSFVWSAEQAVPFLESIAAGLPTGSIVVYREPAPAATVHFGTILIDAPAVPDALWVVDGNQRVTVLASAFLARDGSGLLFAYDLDAGRVVEFPEDRESSPELLPLRVLARDDDFRSWLAGHRARTDDAESVRAGFLDYPMMLADISQTSAAPEVFARLNTGGVQLRPEEIERALAPRDMASLIERLDSMRFGRFPRELVGESVAAVAGSTAVADTWRAFRATASWLRDEAAVPHLDVWRRPELLPVIVLFFARNPAATARARTLLRRWLWRTMSAEAQRTSDEAITGRDSVDASRLLSGAPATPPTPQIYLANVGQELALTTLGPRSLATGERVDVVRRLARWGRDAFRSLTGEPIFSPPTEGDLTALVHGSAAGPAVLSSHALDGKALDLLAQGRDPEFHDRRRQLLAEALLASAAGLAEWGASDRPAISALIVLDEEADDG